MLHATVMRAYAPSFFVNGISLSNPRDASVTEVTSFELPLPAFDESYRYPFREEKADAVGPFIGGKKAFSSGNVRSVHF